MARALRWFNKTAKETKGSPSRMRTKSNEI